MKANKGATLKSGARQKKNMTSNKATPSKSRGKPPRLQDKREPLHRFENIISAASSFRVHSAITFDMNFGKNPALVVTFLRSYEHFGRAVLYFDGNLNKSLELLGLHRRQVVL